MELSDSSGATELVRMTLLNSGKGKEAVIAEFSSVDPILMLVERVRFGAPELNAEGWSPPYP